MSFGNTHGFTPRLVYRLRHGNENILPHIDAALQRAEQIYRSRVA